MSAFAHSVSGCSGLAGRQHVAPRAPQQQQARRRPRCSAAAGTVVAPCHRQQRWPAEATAACPRHGTRRPRSGRGRAVVPLATPQQQQAPADAPPLVALKEWAVTVAALGAGEQTILLRKGGIKEPRFVPEARRFLLFPTAFHSDAQLLKPGVAERHAAAAALNPKAAPVIPISVYAEVTGCWTTEDPRVQELLDPLHVWSGAFLDARLKWRRSQPLTLLELRAYRLEPLLALPNSEELFGCFSWVRLPGLDPSGVAAAVAAAAPALADEEFAAKQALLRAKLPELGTVPVEF